MSEFNGSIFEKELISALSTWGSKVRNVFADMLEPLREGFYTDGNNQIA